MLIYTNLYKSQHVLVFTCFKIRLMSVSTGVENLNDVAKQSYFSSCKWNPAEEILLTEWRMTANSLLCRKKRNYQKKNYEYWEEGIQSSRKRRRTSILLHEIC